MGLIKTAEQILAGRARPVDLIPAGGPGSRKGIGGRRPLGRLCDTPGCGKKHRSNGLCEGCKYRLNRWGSATHVYVRGPGNDCLCPVHKPKRVDP